MSAGQAEAIKKTPPAGLGTGLVGAAMSVPVVVASATGLAVNTVQTQPLFLAGQWYTFISTANCHIRFGGDAALGAAAQADYPMIANVEYDWFIDNGSTFFSVIRDTAATDGVLWRYQSNK